MIIVKFNSYYYIAIVKINEQCANEALISHMIISDQ